MDEKKITEFIEDVGEAIEDVEEIVKDVEEVGAKAGGLITRIKNAIIRFINYIKNLFRKG